MPGSCKHDTTFTLSVNAGSSILPWVNHHGVNTTPELRRINLAQRGLQTPNARRLLSCFLDFGYQAKLLPLAQREEQQAADAATEVIDLEAPATSVSAVGTSSASGTASTAAGGYSPAHRAFEFAAARTPQPPGHLSPRHPGLLPPPTL